MEKRRMPRYLINWVKAFISNRTLSFSFDSQTEPPAPFKSGLPQGSLVSPILFLILANIVIEQSIPEPDPTVSYIGDIGMAGSGTSYITTTEKLRSRADELKWAETVGLNFAPDKSELIHCAAKGTRHKSTLIINGTDQTGIRLSKQIKQLGIVTPSFKPHVIQAASPMRRCLGALRFLRSGKIKISAHIANHLGLTAVLPKLL
jgi:hypothetical protein